MDKKNSCFGLGLLVASGISCPAQAQARFHDVPPQPLEDALIEFAEEARLSLNYSALNLDGLHSNGTKGHISKEAALRAILRDTGITFLFLDDRTVDLFIPAPASLAEPPPTNKEKRETPTPNFIQDLVVTAVKRPSSEFELPVSVSGVSALVLEDLGTYDLQSLAPHLAGVSTTNLGPGRNKIFVRGLSDGPFADRTQAMVGVYIDETPVNLNDTNPDIRLYDVDRIELVRGPQGTLYGAGSLGGLYRIITAKPKADKMEGKARATVSGTRGGGTNGLLDVVYNQPLVRDKVGFRFTGYAEWRDGYIDNTALEENNTNDLAIYGIRPSLRWHVDEFWTVDASINYQSIRYDDSQYFFAEEGRNRRSNLLTEPYDDDFIHGNLTIKGRLGSMYLTSATAFIDRTVKETADASEGLPFLAELSGLPANRFVNMDVSGFGGAEEFLEKAQEGTVAYFTRDDIHTFSHETRLQSGPGQRLEWLLGFYYLNRRQKMDSALALAFRTDDAHVALREDREENTEEIAMFGEAVFRVTKKFDLTAGVRYSRNDLALDYRSEFVLDDDVRTVLGKKETNKVIPKVAARYAWSDHFQAYAQVSAGYRVGGLNIDTPLEALVAAESDEPFPNGPVTAFQSDTLFNYEAGIKSYWFDRRLSFNVSAFYVRWSDIQSDQIGPTGLPFVTNVGNARNLGYEIEFSANPLAGLELRGSFFWNDSELQEDNAFLGAFKGDRLPAIPENTASLALLYQFAIGPRWEAAFSADVAYTGRSALTFNEAESPEMGNFGIINARFQVSDDKWKFGIFAQNLADTYANTFSFGNSFTVLEGNQITPPRPRTLGLFLERRF